MRSQFASTKLDFIFNDELINTLESILWTDFTNKNYSSAFRVAWILRITR